MLFNSILLLSLLLTLSLAQQLYNHNPSSVFNATWMGLLDNGIPIRQMSLIGSHYSMSQGTWGDAVQTQSNSLNSQMNMGIRALDIQCRHKNDQLYAHYGIIYLNAHLGNVLATVRSWLQAYPTQTILMRIVEQYNPSGNSRSFADTFGSYRNTYSDIIWTPTSQNPVLGQVRGKVVILQDFTSTTICGILWSTFTVLPHKGMGTNWDLYDKWMSVKSFMAASDVAGSSRISFWTGNGGSFPYFVASGKSSPGNGAPRLVTGLTTPGFKNKYPDFPRVACFIGICSIVFEGINVLAYNYMINQGFSYQGILFTDFVGDNLLASVIGRNSGRFVPCPAALLSQGCTYCSSTGQCLGCNSTQNYVYVSSNKTCKAAQGYYLLWTSVVSNQAVTCDTAMPGCLVCSSDTVCTKCDVLGHYKLDINNTCGAAYGYYLDALSTPILCPIQGCFQCQSASVCLSCSDPNNYILNTSQLCQCDTANLFLRHPTVPACICQPGYYLTINSTCQAIPRCPANNSGCLNCNLVPSPACTLCDAGGYFEHYSNDPGLCVCMTGFFFDGSTCQRCNSTLSGACQQCAGASLCLSCVDNFTLENGDCVCIPQYYQFDSDTCLQCPIGCLFCTSATVCQACDSENNFTMVGTVCECPSGMFLNVSQVQCQVCGAMTGCLTCNMAGCTSCDPTFGFLLQASTSTCQCDYGYYINSMQVCQACSALGCLDCQSQTNCTQCNQFFNQSSSGVCIEICGDGVLFDLECDDNNTNDGDGCSSSCQVEKDYTCVGGSSISASDCSYSGPLEVTFTSFTKAPTSNKVQVTAVIKPALSQLAFIDFNEVFIPDFPTATKNTTYDPSTGTINLEFTYDTSLNNRQLSILFDPPATPQYFYMQKVSSTLPATTTNNLALKVYTQEEYDLAEKQQYAVWAIGIFAIALFLVTLFIGSRLMGLQMILIFQLGYATLLAVEKRQLLMTSLKYLYVSNGYNDLLSDSSADNLPQRIQEILYKAAFLANFNLSILFVAIPVIVGIIVLFVGKKMTKKPLRLRAYKILKEWVFFLLLFVQTHLTISMSLTFAYDDSKSYGLMIGGLIYVGLILEAILFTCSPKNFGEFKKFFRPTKLAQNWYLGIAVFRTALALTLGILWNSSLCCYALVALSAIWLLAGIIVRPYTQNARPILNNLILVGLMGLYTYASVTSGSQQVTILTSYLSLFIISLLLLALVINLIFIIIFKVRECRQAKQKLAKDQMLMQDEQESRKIDNNYLANLKEQLKDSLSKDIQTRQIEQIEQDYSPMDLMKKIKKDLTMREMPSDRPQDIEMNVISIDSGDSI